jgi:anti-sigma factor RsiW
MIDYHFGRLSPTMNAAVEQHVRSCEKCQAEGMAHLATEKRSAVRLSRRGYGGRSGGFPRVVALIAALLLIGLMVYLMANSKAHARGPSLGVAPRAVRALSLPRDD